MDQEKKIIQWDNPDSEKHSISSQVDTVKDNNANMVTENAHFRVWNCLYPTLFVKKLGQLLIVLQKMELNIYSCSSLDVIDTCG